LLVDDDKLDKKHVNLYEPVWIYPQDSHQPIELVVNKISKDKIHGYLSAPKYPEGTSGAQSAPAAGAAGVPASQDSGASPAPSGALGSAASTQPKI
jgi:hypothetical protein